MAIKFKIDEQKEALKKEYEAKGKKPPKKFKIKNKKPRRQKLAIVSLAISALITLVMVAYVALPVTSVVIGALGFVVYGLIILIPSSVTIGLIWLSPGWRIWANNFANNILKFFGAGSYAASKMIPAFPYIASFGGVFVVINLVFSIHVKRHPDLKETGSNTRFMLSIVLASIYLIFLIIDIVLITTGVYN